MGFGLDLSMAHEKSFTFEDACSQYAALVRGAGGDGYAKLPAAANASDFIGFSRYAIDSEGKRLNQPVVVQGGITLVRASAAFAMGALLRIADTTGRVQAVQRVAAARIEHLNPSSHAADLAVAARSIISCKALTASGATGPFKQFANTAVASNEMTLGFVADGLLAVTITAGGQTGRCNLLPAGVAPASSKDAALSADRQKVKFLAGDAVTAATIDVLKPAYARLGQLKIGQTGESPEVGEVCLNSDMDGVVFNSNDNVTEVLIEYLVQDTPQNVVAVALGAAVAANDLVPALIVRSQTTGLSA